ncbi:MAG TPA: NAD(P)-dependent oxidoreductase [Candidatus Latescibacteria bacterium]|jgi:3-hydroxyisobutyrate dehydrogenase|nr:2-hydroxy-3-oxopropionate reductase [Gemmatimonadaceae bacterium]HJP28977.1 NAD(P)-dependent oxidoreductase [Candidatus Latescibacterota bacterium]
MPRVRKADYTVGVVGVGRMGANIARHLKDDGFPVSVVYDTHRPLATKLARSLKAKVGNSLADVTAQADYIITVVTDDASMKDIFSTRGDSLLVNARGKTFINCATISPETHVEVEKRAAKAKARTLEGCMASSITQARDGTLYLMCGGRKPVFDRCRPLLDSMSVSLRYIGTSGKAAQVKALVNMVMNINTAGLAEGLGLGKALGLDLKVLMEVFSQTGANSRVLETDGEDMVARDHECYFSAAHAAKDSGIALKVAASKNLSLPLARASKSQFDKMIKIGKGELDKSGVAELTFPGRSAGAGKPATSKKAKAAAKRR